MKYMPGSSPTVAMEKTNEANGMTRDQQGRLVSAEHLTRRVTRYESDGSLTVIANSFQGKRLLRPNDVIVKSDGSIYFTDPGGNAAPEEWDVTISGVYRVSPDLGSISLIIDDMVRPNGLAFSPDESTLYVADTRRRHVRAYQMQANGTIGKEIMRAAVDVLKRVTLELGGKSPNIVFADADLEAAASGAFGGIFFNQGQACVAGSRLFVEASIADELVEQVVQRAGAIRLGSGLDPETQMGPLISANHRTRVRSYVDSAAEQGAEVAVGGSEATIEGLEGGFFLEPTVLTGVRNDMKAAREEIFGPVLAVIPWKDEDELIALANGSDYGLASGIWTSDVSKALRVAERLDAGTVWINTYGMFDVAVPFGGRKHSGFGKELGEEALEPYLHSKSVWVDLTAAVPQSGQGITR